LHQHDVDHRRLVDEGWIDAAKAVAPKRPRLRHTASRSCGVDSSGVISAMSVEFDAARRDLDI
jgi:hypothetical protein